MITHRDKPDGTRMLVVLLTFRNRTTGATERYRRDAQVQTRAGAQSEERRIIEHFGSHGTIAALLAPPKVEKPVEVEVHTWADAVRLYEAWAPANLADSTRAGYSELLDSPWFVGWERLDLARLAGDEAFLRAWDAKLQSKLGESRRRNAHVVMRTVFRVAEQEGWHAGLVRFFTGAGRNRKGLPKVPERTIHATHPEDLSAILSESDEGVCDRISRDRKATRLAFAIVAFGGLRPSEVRALKWKHVDLRRGLLHVKEARVVGVTAGTKDADERTINIGSNLLGMLKAAKDARGSVEPDHYVAPTSKGTPMSDKTLYHAIVRACDRLGLERGKVYGLRHLFCTELARSGTVNPKAIQRMAGHSSLSTTQRYIDAVDADLAKAAAVFDGPRFQVIEGGRRKTG